jgi:hypothetical protein
MPAIVDGDLDDRAACVLVVVPTRTRPATLWGKA